MAGHGRQTVSRQRPSKSHTIAHANDASLHADAQKRVHRGSFYLPDLIRPTVIGTSNLEHHVRIAPADGKHLALQSGDVVQIKVKRRPMMSAGCRQPKC